jgi:peptidase MA superfamily protein
LLVSAFLSLFVLPGQVATSVATVSRSEFNVQQAPLRLDRGRFTVVCYPADERLASALLARAVNTDSFPGLPRPKQHVLIAIAPDERRFREWAGAEAPEWGAALAFPDSRRIVMQGSGAGSDAGDPFEVLRHEIAHLALHEYLGDLPPRWFDEGYASYAARELTRNEVLATNFALALRGMPDFEELDDRFTQGVTSAQAAYALAYRAVDDLASIDRANGLSRLFQDWKQTGSLDRAMRAAFGMTLPSFEHEWQQRTRRRYGGLALFSDLTLATVILLLIITPLYLARRRRDRQRMAVLVAADAVAEREMSTAIEALLASENGTPPQTRSDSDATGQ